jgi:RNA polymerase sigma-70 factor (ECF subfamily)
MSTQTVQALHGRTDQTTEPIPMTPVSDDDLEQVLARAQRGAPDALDAVYRRFQPDIQRYLQRRTGDPALAADLTSDVFVSVLEAIQSGRAWRTSFTSWLYRIAQHRLIDHIRRTRRRGECGLSESMATGGRASMDDHVERAVLADDVREAIGTLRPAEARIIRLRFRDDLTHADVGRLVGKHANAVKVAQFRALRRMRSQIEQHPRLSALAS